MSRAYQRYAVPNSASTGSWAARRTGRRWAYKEPPRYDFSLGSAFRKALAVALIAVCLFPVAVIVFKMWVDSQTSSLIYSPDSPDLPGNHVALVFGAGLNAEGGPSAMLYDRVYTAADLYKTGKVDKLLMTGDNSEVDYNEVAVMRKTAIQLGVSDQDIVLDYAGFSTWDSCYRAKEVFSVSEATLVTQRFHLPRALYTCNHLGISAVGVAADRQSYSTLENELREYAAVATTAFRIVTNDPPRFLGPKIDVDQPQER